MKRKTVLPPLFASLLTVSACSNYSLIDTSKSLRERPAGWETLSHADNVTPNYDVVFPEGKVNRMDITIAAADWKLMQENMDELFGDRNQPSGGNRPGGPGFGPPPEGGFPALAPGQSPPPGFPAPPTASGSPTATGATASDSTPPASASAAPAAPFQRPTGGGPGGGGALQFAEENPIYRPAKISFEGKTWEKVGVRFKGNSSLASSWGRTLKLPFRLDFDEFEDEYPEVHDQRFWGFKRLSLSSGFSDNSLIREKVTADIFRAAGVPAARTAFYRVYVDYGEGSKYFGLYTMVEVPDTPMFSTQFKSTEGNLYKPEGNGARFGTFEQSAFEKKTNEEQADWSDIQAVFTALHASRENPESWRAGLDKVFDTNGFLRYLAVNTLIQNWDTYGAMAHNYYLYTDSDKKVHWIPWDNNMALSGGGFGGGMGGPPGIIPGQAPSSAQPSPLPSPSVSSSSQTTQPPALPDFGQGGPRPAGGGPGRGGLSLALTPEEVNDSWPLIRYLIDDPVYKALYVKFVRETLEQAFAIAPTEARYTQAYQLITPYVIGPEGEQADATLLQSQAAFESALDQLKQHLASRHQAANSFLAAEAKANNP